MEECENTNTSNVDGDYYDDVNDDYGHEEEDKGCDDND